MTFTQRYNSPMGGILLAADEIGLTGVWFDGQKYFARGLPKERTDRNTPVLSAAKCWLDVYFTGREPDFMPPLNPIGSEFQRAVWELLLQIPYGQTTTYGALAQELAKRQELAHMSAQAVGGAVGRNKISILIPCHRVIAADGTLGGYSSGVERKRFLLRLEGLSIPESKPPRRVGKRGVRAR